MNAFVRWAPRLLIGGAILHIGVGLALWTPFAEIAEAGIIDSIDPYPRRQYAFWYLMSGVAWLTLGELARWTLRETGRVPARVGGWLIGIGVTGIVFMPASGFWLIAAVGAIVLRAARQTDRHAAEPSARAAAGT